MKNESGIWQNKGYPDMKWKLRRREEEKGGGFREQERHILRRVLEIIDYPQKSDTKEWELLHIQEPTTTTTTTTLSKALQRIKI